MMQLRLAAEALTLWVQRPSSSDEAPPLCGAMPMEDGYICSVGEMVCAKVIVTSLRNEHLFKHRYLLQSVRL